MANTAKFLQVGAEGAVLTFRLGNGLKVVFDCDAPSAAIQSDARIHGFNQKIRDSAAGFSKTGDYQGAFRAMQTVADNLMAGLWNSKGGTGTGDLVQAIANLKKISVEDAQDAVDGLDEEQLKSVLGKPAVKAEILRIKAERAAAVAAASDDDGDIGV